MGVQKKHQHMQTQASVSPSALHDALPSPSRHPPSLQIIRPKANDTAYAATGTRVNVDEEGAGKAVSGQPQVKAFEKLEEEESTQDLLAGMQQQQQPGVSTTRRERSR